MSALRVLFTVDQAYLPQRTGGALESTNALCRALAEQGHEVAVVAALAPRGMVWVVNRLKRRFGSRLPRDHAAGYPVYRDWEPAAQVPLLCRSFRPDVAVVKSGSDPRMAEALAAEGVPTLVYLRDLEFDHDDWRCPQGRNIHFLANTTFAADRFAARFAIRPPVIHSLVYADRYRVASSRKVVTFINPRPVKGVAVAADLARHRPDIPFQFIESWPLNRAQYAEVRSIVDPLPNVTLRRWMPDIRHAYAETRILIVPSQWVEAQARSVAEVQLSGIPVIASDVGGLPESVGPGGILVGQQDTEGWRRALGQLWDDEDAYAAASAQALAHARRPQIQPDHVVASFTGLLQRAVAQGHAGAAAV